MKPDRDELDNRGAAPASAGRQRRWAVILAGGDGTRLQGLTRFICGDDRPKQFCPLFGERTLLEQTLRRCERVIPGDQSIVSLTVSHANYYARETALRPAQRVVQPSNKGTAPPIVHSLLSLLRMDPEALVAIFPCDHHYSDEPAFVAASEGAFEAAAVHSDCVLLLGAKPSHPETEYGWIELGTPVGTVREMFRVRAFQEKPELGIARKLLAQGSVWNTFVMVGHVQAFMEMVLAAVPGVVGPLASARLWTRDEIHIEDAIYRHLPSVCFSRGVLSRETTRLAVLPLGDVEWSDLGDPERALSAVRASGYEPLWTREWNKPAGPVVRAAIAALA